MGFYLPVTSAPSDDARVAPGSVVVPVPADAAARDALTARLAALTDVRHAHLVAVLDVRTVRPGAVDVDLARGEAADLPAVLAVRGRLSPGEAGAVGINIAQALAALHAAGLVHGPVEPGDVVLRSGGAPALRPRVTTPPEEWTPAEDVRAVARLVDMLLGSRSGARAAATGLDGDPVVDPDGALRTTLAPALAADGRRRPEAGTLAALIDGACEPCDVRLPDPATLAAAALTGARRPVVVPERHGGSGTGGGRGRRGGVGRPAHGGPQEDGGQRSTVRPARRPVPRVAVVVAGVGLAVGVMTGAALQLRPGAAETRGGAMVASSHARAGSEAGASQGAASPAGPDAQPAARRARGGAPSASPAAKPASGAQDPVLDRSKPAEAGAALTQRRLDLLAGTVTDVGSVDAAGSPALDADAALLARLQEAGTRPVDPHASVTSAAVVSEEATTAQIRVEYVVEAHAQRAADGATTQVSASAPAVSVLSLLWTSQGWRVEGVV